ncbi:MAG: hypothetical protein K0V04_36640 [Deltaproteobacteria bacterium]|nr:hypothetical protein [Deltaproteobacteria bacterium]
MAAVCPCSPERVGLVRARGRGVSSLEQSDSEIEWTPARTSRAWWWWALAVLVLVGAGTWASRQPQVGMWWRGEIDWHGDRIYAPQHPPGLDAVDLVAVHEQLLPAWIIARGRRTRGLPGAAKAEDEAFERLQTALEPDGNLLDIAQQWRSVAVPHALGKTPRRALYLGWAWNHYLEQHEVPLFVQLSVLGTRFGPAFTAGIYHVHADAAVAVGTSAHRVRVISRVDHMNLREAYLGAAGHDGAVVVVDRLRDFTLAEVWPLLDPWAELSPATRSRFGAALRAEAEAQLPPEDFERLQASAGARWRITKTLDAIADRRVSCSSGFRINDVPPLGFPTDRLANLEAIAERHATRWCPGITTAEVEVLREASASLSAVPGLEPALDVLVAWGAQHVAIHEARHLADAATVDGFEQPLDCVSCPEAMGVQARTEVSGYLAGIAWSPSPALALYQACRSLATEHRRPTGSGSPHREALELLLRRMGPVCALGPPQQLHALGRLLEMEMLGRSDPMALPADFPRRLARP